MFKPRHAYRSPITNRYRGKAKGCPVFNNLNEISSSMVEQHDECLECLAKLKNRSELYRTLAENNKPNNNVIKSLQRLSSSASNNRLKTCLQFLIIKVNEKSISTPKQATTTTNGNASPKSTTTVNQTDIIKDASADYVVANQTHIPVSSPPTATQTTSSTSTSTKISKRHKLRYQQQKQRKSNQLASPPQDQVSSTQDQDGPAQDDHDCQTSPLMLIDSLIDESNNEQMVDGSATTTIILEKSFDEDGPMATTMTSSTATITYDEIKSDLSSNFRNQCSYMTAQSTQPSPPVSSCNAPSSPKFATKRATISATNHISTATSTSTATATTSTSPIHIIDYESSSDKTNIVKKNIVECFVAKTSGIHNGIDFKDQIKATSLGSNGSITSNSSSNSSTSSSSSSSSSSGSSSSGSTPTNANTDSDNNNRKLQNLNQPQSYQTATKRRRVQNSLSSDHETSSLASWSLASYGAGSPPSPISSASSSSLSSTDSIDSDSISSYYGCSDASSSCSSAYSRGSSPSPPTSSSPPPLSSPEINIELKGPRLKLSEDKIRRIKKRPVLFDEYFLATEQIYPHRYQHHHQPPTYGIPTASVGCSPGQQSSSTQNSDHGSTGSSSCSSGFGSCLGLSVNSMMTHTFQAPPTFINNLKPCNLPKPKPQEQSSTLNAQAVSQAKMEMLNCAICGIREKPPKISKIFGQNSCLLCTEFFADFLKSPKQYYCAHDGDCLMTFDSRCQACWIKICLQKFDVDEENRKIGEKYSPKLLLSPNVSLITIDTS